MRRAHLDQSAARQHPTVGWIAAVALLCAACSAAPDQPLPSDSGPAADTLPSHSASTGSAAPPSIVAELVRSRVDDVAGAIRIQLTNTGEEPVDLGEATIAADVVDAESTTFTSELTPGRTVARPVRILDVTCEETTPRTAPMSVSVQVDGRPVIAEVSDTTGITTVLTRFCEQEFVVSRLAAELVAPGSADDDALPGELHLQRLAGEDELAVVDVRGNAVLKVTPPTPPAPDRDRPMTTIAPGLPTAVLPVTLTGNNCSPHAIGEGKRNHLVETWVRVGDHEPLRLDVDISETLSHLLQELCDVTGP